MGVCWKKSNKQDNGERRFIRKYSGKHEEQVTGTIAVILTTQTDNKSLKMTITALAITLSSPSRTADETPSDSSKAFALQRRSSSNPTAEYL
ncbi:hypothetical protein AVEN_132140-1 [Araneus ventricosus]|uniref:Uncharacterized protein n=1 Tax=Araneus ventricosus TaxID=182803 RepID=A0A4Y2S5P5_ARAVE|nr:hypothetical protein AVEN_254264-1 [Araneus ventricosus]GBN79414.1 hypothetical protein AVEN_210684-1 [Araneus ventricosus]GBN82475.1 hypothetical protein AVEN_80420-1 [Araneus ventricosus]GBN82595.1 hypothetical protein AVEN_132140-1 [Araneus ventricosus]